jgi:hypothetical protein
MIMEVSQLKKDHNGIDDDTDNQCADLELIFVGQLLCVISILRAIFRRGLCGFCT